MPENANSMSTSQAMTGLKQALCDVLPEGDRRDVDALDLSLSRLTAPVVATRCFYRPTMAIIVEGQKHSTIGNHLANYTAGQCLVVGVDLPGVFHIADASPEHPFLSVAMPLDRDTLQELGRTLPLSDADMRTLSEEEANSPVMITDASAALIEAMTRLVALVKMPDSAQKVLGPMIRREIHYHLLTSPMGALLRRFMLGEPENQIAKVIGWLRENFAQATSVEALAKLSFMAPSTFHRHFKEVTGMSPLQFQKQLRLYEAERLMLMEGKDASTAASLVGYESGSQFNREYKRHFGEPPRRDVQQKRELLG